MRTMLRLLSALLVWLAAQSAAAAQPQEPMAAYQVVAGDTLIALAGRYMEQPSDYLLVQQLNGVADPRRLQPGTVLQIPVRLLRGAPVAARIAAFRGQVTITGRGGDRAARVGASVGEGALITTGPNAFVTVELADGSRVSLPSQSRIRVERLRRLRLTGEIHRVFRLEDGRSTSVVTPTPDARGRFIITTPVTVAAVRGTEFRVGYDQEVGRATLGVVEGHVADRALGEAAETMVPATFGRTSDATGGGAPEPLLPAPRLIDPQREQSERQVRFRTTSVEGAGAYRAQLATDPDFIDVFAEQRSRTPDFVFEGLENGHYFARFTALTPGGLEGLPAAYGVGRWLNAVDLLAPEQTSPGLDFRWRASGAGEALYRFQLSAQPDMSSPLVDVDNLSEARFGLAAPPAGVYYWRVFVRRFDERQISETWSSVQRLQIGR
ncbi:MAG: FecR domain-containing protein [Phenylobacterium sp.]|nr:FecR domain-containing protein [Phenylobacterium sp.]